MVWLLPCLSSSKSEASLGMGVAMPPLTCRKVKGDIVAEVREAAFGLGHVVGTVAEDLSI